MVVKAKPTDSAVSLLDQLPAGTTMSQNDGTVTYLLPESASISAAKSIATAANLGIAIKLTQVAATVSKQETIGDVSSLSGTGTALTLTDPDEISDNFVLNTKTGQNGAVKSSVNDPTSANYVAIKKNTNGYVILTTTGSTAGSYAYQNLIDTTKTFTISGGFQTTVTDASGNAQNASSTGGGGLGIILQGANPSSAGLTSSSNPGANVGIASDGSAKGVANATFAGFDAYKDSVSDADFATGLVLIRQTDADGMLTDRAHSALAPSTIGGGQVAINSKFVLSWVPDGTLSADGRVNGELSLAMYADAAHTKLLQQTALKTSLDASTAVAAFGSFGGLGNNVGFRAATVDSLNLTAATANITIKYLTDTGTKFSPNHTVAANVGTTLTIAPNTDAENDTYAPTLFDGYTFWKAVGTVSGDNTVKAINITYAGDNSADADDITITYVKSAELGNLDNQSTVQAAQTNLVTVLSQATDSNSAAVLAAQTALSTAVTDARDARTTATDAAALVSLPTNIANEPYTGTGAAPGETLADAEANLEALVVAANDTANAGHATATTEAITVATTGLQSVITQASAAREQAIADADAILAAGKGYNYTGTETKNGQQAFAIITELKDAGAKLAADLSASAAGNVTTAQIKTDSAAFKAITDQIDAVVAGLQDSTPYQQEPEVATAYDQLMDTDMQSTLSLANFLNDITVLNTALTTAANTRTAVETTGTANIQTAKDAGVDATPVLAAAIKNFQENVTAAAAGTVATATEKTSADKIKALTTTVTDANTAIAAAKTTGVDNETAVSESIKALDDLLNSATATPEAIAAATSTLNTVVATATTTRTAANTAATANSTNITPYKNETTQSGTTIAELKQQLDKLVTAAGDADNTDHLGATSDAIANATTALTTAFGDAANVRTQVTAAGDAAVNAAATQNLTALTVVANAINAYQQAATAAEGGEAGSSTAAIDDAVKRLQAIVAAGQVSNEPDVTTAIVNLNATSVADTQAAIDVLTAAVTTAQADREAAKSDGTATVAAVPEDAQTDVAVTTAIANYNTVVNNADLGEATTVDLQKASAAVDAVVAENAAEPYQQNPEVRAAQNQLDTILADGSSTADDIETAAHTLNAAASNLVLATNAANNIITAPYSKDASVADAKTTLDTLIANPASSTTAITDGVIALENALNTAQATRETVEKAGTDLVNEVSANKNLSDNPEVKQALAAYQAATNSAANDEVGTDTEQTAVAALDAVVTAVENARSAVGEVNTSPYSKDAVVVAAQKVLDNLLGDSSTTAAAINTAKTALVNAVTTATNTRSNVEQSGNAANEAVANNPNLNQNAEVSALQDAYNDAVAAAAIDAGSTETEKNALNALTAVIDAVNNARAAAKAVVTAPYSQDAVVSDAQGLLNNLINSPSSTADAINIATNDLKNAVVTASAARNLVEASGVDAQKQINTDLNLNQNAEVKGALDAYTDAVTAAKANTGSTEVEQTTLSNLNNVITAINNARDSAHDVATSPYSQDESVQNAQTKLDTLIGNHSSSALTIDAAVTVLKDAVTTAEQARKTVEANANDVVNKIAADQNLNQNADVQSALKNYNGAVTAAKENTGSTETEQDALSNLNATITAVNNARNAADNLVTNPYDQDAVVHDAQAALKTLIADPTSSAAAIADAATNVENAVAAAKLNRDKVETIGAVTMTKIADDANLKLNPDVMTAQKMYDEALIAAADNKGSTETEKTALDTLSAAITAVENAREAAAEVKTSPYSRDDGVKLAQAALDAVISSPTSTAEGITNAKTVLENAVTTAISTRDQVEASGVAIIVRVTGDANLNQNPDVVVARNAYNDAVTAAANNTGSTEAEKTALDTLNTAITAVDNARDAAGKVTTSPYSQDDAVKLAQAALDAVISSPTSTAEGITNAKTVLENAVTTAISTRDQVEASGVAVIARVTGDANLNQNPDVVAARNAYNDAVTAAVNNTGSTEAEKTALDTLNTAITAVDNARDAAGKVTTNPYSQDDAVKLAQAALDTAINDVTSTAAVITNAKTALENAVIAAISTRNQVEAGGATVNAKITGDTNLNQNPDVVAAQKTLDDAITSAADNTGSTEAEQIALNQLNNVISTIENARETAGDVQTSPYTHDAAVIVAQANLTAVVDSPSSTDALISSAKMDLQNAVTTAKATREIVEANGTTVTGNIAATDNLKGNPEVQAAEQDYNDAVADGLADKGSTEQIQTALDKLNAVIAAVENARTSANAVETKPYSLDAIVKSAKDNLNDLIKDSASTADGINAAKTTLENAITTATGNRDAVVANGTTVTEKITATDNLKDNPEIQAAEQDYNNAVVNGLADKGSTEQIQAALDKLNAVIAAVENARTSANAVETKPYSLDAIVKSAKNNLNALIEDSASTADGINAAKTTLENAITTATGNRDAVVANGTTVTEKITTTDNLKNNSEIQAAEQDYNNAVVNGLADKGSTEQIQTALDKLNAVIAAVENARTSANNVQTEPYSLDAIVKSAKKNLDDLIEDSTSSAAEINDAKITLENAITAATKNRANVVASGVTVLTKIDGNPNLKQNAEVQAAQTAYTDAVTAAGNDMLSIEMVQSALADLNATITAVENARSAAANVETKPYSQDAVVKDAKQTLGELTATPESTATLINSAVTVLENAVTAAKTARDNVETSGKAANQNIDNNPNLNQNSDVLTAQSIYAQTVADAAVDKGGTEAEQAALGNLNAIITAVENARTSAGSVVTRPYSQDTDVKAANQALNDLLSDTSTSTAAAINAAVTAVENAVTAAKTTRDTVEKSGKTVQQNIDNNSNLNQNADVQVAQATYKQTTEDAAADEGSTEAEQAALDNLNAVITAIEAARTAASTVATFPYSKDSAVQAAKNALTDLLNDPSSTAVAIRAAQAAVENAITTAKTARDTVETDGDTVIAEVNNDNSLKLNTEVQTAQTAYVKAVTAAGQDQGSTEAEQSALNVLNAAMTAVENAREAAGSVQTRPYSQDTIVLDAQTALNDLITEPTSTATAIDNAKVTLENAVTTAKSKRITVEASGQAVITMVNQDANLNRNPDVESALAAYTSAVAAAGANSGSTESEQTALDNLQAIITSVEAARAAAGEVMTSPYSQEEGVQIARATLDALRDDSGSTAASITAAKTAVNNAVSIAKSARDTVEANGTELIEKITADESLKQNADVHAAQSAYVDAVNAAATGVGSTATEQSALEKLSAAITDIEAARSAAKIATAPYTEEATVKEDKQSLQTLLDDSGSSAAAIIAASKALQNAVAAAATKRTETIAEGVEVTKSAPVLALYRRSDVALALAEYTDAVSRATDDIDVTASIQKAIDDLKAALAKVQAAIAAANAVSTAEFAQEPTVVRAQDQLDTLLDSDSRATAEEIHSATDKLKDAVAAATNERLNVTTPADTSVKSATQCGISSNDDIAAAIQAYQDSKGSATTAVVKNAANELQAVISQLNTAVEGARSVVTAPVSKDTRVAGAKTVVDALLANPDTSAADLITATETLRNAVTKAQAERAVVVATGASLQGDITGENFVKNPDVAEALQNYLNVQKLAEDDQASTAELQTALSNLQNVVSALNTAIDDAKSVVSTPFGKDAAVVKAQKTLNDVLTDPSSGANVIQEATQDLRNAIEQAQIERTQVEASGDTLRGEIEQSKAGDNPEIVTALQNYRDVVEQAQANAASTGDERTTLTELQKIVDELNTARNAAEAVQTGAYAKDIDVIAANNELQSLLGNTGSTAVAISAATQKLQDALTEAVVNRAIVVKQGNEIVKQVTQVAGGKKLVNEYNSLKERTAAGQASTTDLHAVVAEISAVIATAAKQTAETEKSASQPNGRSKENIPSVNALPQLGDASGKTSIAGILGLAASTMFALLSYAQKRKEDDK